MVLGSPGMVSKPLASVTQSLCPVNALIRSGMKTLTIPLLSCRGILHIDFESGRCARSLQQGVLGSVPVATALDPFCNGRIIEGIILEVDLGD